MIEIQSKRAAKQKAWREIISRQQNSGMAIALFCKAHELNFHTFHYWLKKFSRSELVKPLSGRFVTIANLADRHTQKARIILPNGVQVDLGGGLEVVAVQQFLQNLCGVSGARS